MLNAIFLPGQTDITVNGLHQWDYGQGLQIVSEDLSAVIEVHFACVGMKEAIVRVCEVINGQATVSIPDVCLEQSSPITAWIFEINGTVGATTKTITLPVISRARPAVSETVPEEFVDTYHQAIEAITSLVGAFTSGAVVAGKAREAETAQAALNAGSAANARHATLADEARIADDSKKINNLEIKRDANGVLKIGDTVIPQRNLVHSSSITLSNNWRIIYSDENGLLGKTFELVLTGGWVFKFVVDRIARETLEWRQTFTGIGGLVDASNLILRVNSGDTGSLEAAFSGSDALCIEKIYEIKE